MGLDKALVIIPTTGNEIVSSAIKSVLHQTVETDLLLVCDGDKFYLTLRLLFLNLMTSGLMFAICLTIQVGKDFMVIG